MDSISTGCRFQIILAETLSLMTIMPTPKVNPFLEPNTTAFR
jgi:hypothetical protein